MENNQNFFSLKFNDGKFELETNDQDLIKKISIQKEDFDKVVFITPSRVRANFSESIIIDEKFKWVKDIVISNGYNAAVDLVEEQSKKLNRISNLTNKFDDLDFFTRLHDWDLFSENILSKMKGISLNGEFGEVTLKQLVRVYVYSQLDNYANFSEPGTGKTITTLMSFFNKERELKKELRLFVVCPINAIDVWREEIINFTNINEEQIQVYREDYKEKNSNDFFHDLQDKKVVIINYESIKKILKDNSSPYRIPFEGEFIVYDEVHRIKGGGEHFQKAYSLSRRANTRVILTGTPYSKEIEEIKNIFKVNWSGSLPTLSESDFDEYNNTIKINDVNEKNIIELREKLKLYYFKLRKKEDFSIPDAFDNYENPEFVESLEVQKIIDENIYKQIIKTGNRINNAKDNKQRKDLEKILYSLVSSAQVNSLNPRLLKEKNLSWLNVNIDQYDIPEFKNLPKIKRTIELIKKKISNNEKIIVWMRYRSNIEQLSSELNEIGISSEFIHGKIPPVERKVKLDKFNNSSNELMVLVTNPDTLAESISLHKNVHNSIFVERGFSYYQWIQAKDRIHRVGIPEGNDTFHFYIKSNDLWIDKKIFENLEMKSYVDKKIFSDLISDDENDRENVEYDVIDKLFDVDEEVYNSQYNVSNKEMNKKSFDSYDIYMDI